MKDIPSPKRKKVQISARDMLDKYNINSAVLIEDPNKSKRKTKRPNISDIDRVLSKVTTAANDNLAMMELLPDLKLVKRILVSSILSPKDLSSAEIHLTINRSVYEKDVDVEIIETIENHFRTRFNLEEKLSIILEEALFDTGSYCLLTIPESALAEIIAGDRLVGIESIQTCVTRNSRLFQNQLLGNVHSEVLSDLGLEVIDNPRHLVVDALVRQQQEKRHLSLYNNLLASMEASTDNLVMSIRGAFGESGALNNNPLVMKIPSDTIIPVHHPGAPEDHVGYFIVLDGDGNIISRIRQQDHLSNLRKELKKVASGNSLGGLFRSVGISLGGDQRQSEIDPRFLLDSYRDTIEKELTSQLKNGKYKKDVEVSKPESIYQLMLSRKLRGLRTKLLYVPKEIVSYFAFDYNDYGIGKSLLEDTKIFGSLRAILLFAEIMAGVKNSVGRTTLQITLDEDDPDPSATIESVIQQFAGLQIEELPVGHLVAGDIIRSLQKASVDVLIDGGEAFPGTRTEISDSHREHYVPDQELSQTLRRMQYAGLGIPPEIVDSAMEGELATVVVSRNQLFAKQIVEYARRYEHLLTQFIQIYIACSGELVGYLSEQFDEEDIPLFIKSIRMELPDPDLAGIRSQAEAYDEFSEAVDKAMEAFITEDMFSDLLDGEIDSRKLESLRQSMAGVIKRDWMIQQNILPEISSKFVDTEVKDKINKHNAVTLSILEDVLKRILKDENKISKRLEKMKEKMNQEEEEENTDTTETPSEDTEAPMEESGGETTEEPETSPEEGEGGSEEESTDTEEDEGENTDDFNF